MEFIPVYEDELQPAGPVSGRAAVTLSTEKRRVLGLRSAPVFIPIANRLSILLS